MEDDDFSHEYRFMGAFGFGGKLRLGSVYGLTADYYPESRTAELDAKMRDLNLSLIALSVEWGLTDHTKGELEMWARSRWGA